MSWYGERTCIYYGAFLFDQPLKALFNTCHVHSSTHWWQSLISPPLTVPTAALSAKELHIPFHHRLSSQANWTLSRVMHLIPLPFWWWSPLSRHQISPEHFAPCRSSSDWIHILRPSFLVMTCGKKWELFRFAVTVQWRREADRAAHQQTCSGSMVCFFFFAWLIYFKHVHMTIKST